VRTLFFEKTYLIFILFSIDKITSKYEPTFLFYLIYVSTSSALVVTSLAVHWLSRSRGIAAVLFLISGSLVACNPREMRKKCCEIDASKRQSQTDPRSLLACNPVCIGWVLSSWNIIISNCQSSVWESGFSRSGDFFASYRRHIFTNYYTSMIFT